MGVGWGGGGGVLKCWVGGRSPTKLEDLRCEPFQCKGGCNENRHQQSCSYSSAVTSAPADASIAWDVTLNPVVTGARSTIRRSNWVQ